MGTQPWWVHGFPPLAQPQEGLTPEPEEDELLDDVLLVLLLDDVLLVLLDDVLLDEAPEELDELLDDAPLEELVADELVEELVALVSPPRPVELDEVVVEAPPSPPPLTSLLQAATSERRGKTAEVRALAYM